MAGRQSELVCLRDGRQSGQGVRPQQLYRWVTVRWLTAVVAGSGSATGLPAGVQWFSRGPGMCT